MLDRAEQIRDSVRRYWARRSDEYALVAAGHAAHTDMLITTARPQPGEQVLDVATGPGAAAIAAARAVGPSGQVLATDLVPEWAAVIAKECARAGLCNVTFRAMGAEALDLADQSFDLALCQFGLMFVPDRIQALCEMRRVLREGGRLALAVWSTLDKVPHHAVSTYVLRPYLPRVPPEERLPAPVDLGTPGLIENLVRRAGFHDLLVARHTLENIYESDEVYLHHALSSDRVRPVLERLPPEQVEQIRSELRTALDEYLRDGKLYFPSEAVYVTAVRREP